MEPSTVSAPERVAATPEWVQDAVFYQIFPDRFARSPLVHKPSNLEPWDSPPTFDGFKGGDLVGIAEHLDYLQDLGVTALYLNPIFQSAANHRYHTHDYYRVDPILGGDDALLLLLDAAHRRGMRIVLDGVFNHASRGFYQFHSILENGASSPYLDWFHIYHWPLYPYGPGDEPAGYAAWWDLRALPKFNTSTPDVREFLWNVGAYWMGQGVDGWRLDVPNEIDDDEFWREFRRRVKGANGDAYIVGEIWGDARRWLAGDQFDAVMNYLFTKVVIGLFAGTGRGIDTDVLQGSGLADTQPLTVDEFASAVNTLYHLYPPAITSAQLNLLGSHDTPRFLTVARGDASAVKLATLFQMTYPGAPCIYYGDEIGMQGGHDPDCRRSFPWEQREWDEDLRAYIKAAITLRHQHAVLRRGDFQVVHVDNDVLAYLRRRGGEVAVIALNCASESRTISLEVPDGVHDLRATWGDSPFRIDAGRLEDWTIPARSGEVLVGG